MRQASQEQPALTVFSAAARLNRLPVTRAHRAATALIGVGVFFDLYEVFLSGILSAMLARQLGSGAIAVSFPIMTLFAGAFLGAAGLTVLADRVGRRQAFLVSMLVYSVASLGTALSHGLVFLAVTRLIAGVWIGAELPVADSYLADLLPSQHRGRYMAWGYTLGFCGVPVAAVLGNTLATAVSLATTWRLLFVVGSFGALIIAILRRRLPESPRWLEAIGRLGDAARLVTALESQARGHGRLPAPRHDIDPDPRVSYRALLSRPLLRRTIMLGIFQVSQGIGYYGFGTLVPIVLLGRGYSVVASLGFTAACYAGYPLGSLASLLLIDRVERKPGPAR